MTTALKGRPGRGIGPLVEAEPVASQASDNDVEW